MRKTTAALAGGASVLAVGLGSLAYGLIHSHSYRLRRRSVLLPSRDAKPLRILHISDAHTLARHTKRLAFLRDLADTKPDLVVLTGDMIAQAEAIAPVLDALDELLDVPGVFVFGSNDYVAPTFKNPFRYLRGPSSKQVDDADRARVTPLPWRDMRAAFKARGWVDLTNTRATMRVAGWDLDFVGVDDAHMGLDRFPPPAARGVGSDAEAGGAAGGGVAGAGGPGGAGDAGGASSGWEREAATVEGAQARPYARIGVTHAPYQRVLSRMVDDGCSLIFAGHTHGGQVCLPPHNAIVSNCDLDPALASGLFEWPRNEQSAPAIKGDGAVIAKDEPRAAWVQVSAGIGSSTYMPVRTFCPPEAIIIDAIPLAGAHA